MTGIKPATYWLNVSFLGYENFISDAFSLAADQHLNLTTIRLLPASTELAEVEVKAERALIEVQPDKTVFNVDGSINATSNSALELLRKSPGVVVDNGDNIILAGKNGVQIYIDGKRSRLGSDDLAALLRAMQASEIDAIEIITNPSAKYEAEGNAGIINIRLKKDKRFGANANLNAGYSHGKLPKYRASTTFNYRSSRANVFGNYSFNDGQYQNWINLYRIQSNTLFDQKSISRRDGAYNGGRLGIDFFINEKSTFGMLFNGYSNDRNWSTNTYTPITDLATDRKTSVLQSLSDNDGMRRNGNANLNYRYDNGEGVSWNIDADFGIFRNNTDTYQPNYYKTPDERAITETRIFTSQAPTDIDIYTFKTDHQKPLWKGQLETGIKLSLVRTDNTYDFYNIENESELLDIDRSSNFVFEENINAAYLSYNRQIDKFTFNLGLRAEQTNSTGILTARKPTNNDRVKRNYLDFFPSVGLTLQANNKNQYRFNYSRRIDRPSYQDLNPFEFKLSELSYSRGNPFLRPQYTNSFSISHTYNYRLTTSLSYSYTNNFFANISDSTEVIRSFLETVNLDYQKVISLTVSYPFSPKQWWSTYSNISAFHKHNYADLGEGRTVSIRATVASLYHQSTFKLDDNWSLEVSGWFSSPSIWGAVYKMDTNFSIDAGVQRSLWNGRGNLKVTLTDLFNSAPWRGVQEFAGFYVDASGGWESRQIRVSFSYLLGNDQLKSARKRKTGLEEEAQRVNQ